MNSKSPYSNSRQYDYMSSNPGLRQGFSALQKALVYGQEEVAKVLLAAGATCDTDVQPMTMDEYAEVVPSYRILTVKNFAEPIAQEGYKELIEKYGVTCKKLLVDGISHPSFYCNVKVSKGIIAVNKGLPFEVQQLDAESADLYASLLEEESYELFETRDMLVGQQGVGKTTLANFLVGEQPSDVAIPTDGIGLYTGLAFLNKETGEWLSGKIELTVEELLVSRLLKINPLQRKQEPLLKKKSTTKVKQKTPTKLLDNSAVYAGASCSLKQSNDDLITENVFEHSSGQEEKLQKMPESVSKYSSSLYADASCLPKQSSDDSTTENINRHSSGQEEKKQNMSESVSKYSSSSYESASGSTKTRIDTSLRKNVFEHSRGQKERKQNMAPSVSKYILLLKSWEAGDKKLHKMNLVPVIIWDFGGHDVFYATHQTFLTYRAIYTIVIDGSKPLNAVVEFSHQYLPGKAGRKTCKDYLIFWIKAILTYCIKIGNGFPKLVIVATHKDKVPSDQIEVIRQTLYDEIDSTFAETTIHKHIVTEQRLFVDAKDHSDPEMILFKQVLADLAFQQPTWGEKMPACFLPLELELHYLVHKSGKKVIEIDELEAINRQLAIRPLSSEELQLFLKVQHAMGNILYFPFPKLDQKIILAPTHLIDAFRSIITDREFCAQDETCLSSWDDMASKGIIQKSTIEYIWQKAEFKHFGEEKDYLLNLMTHLEFMSEPRRYDNKGKLLETDFFLVPSMIRQQNDTRFFKTPDFDEKAICLSFVCVNEILPPGLCYRFITHCLSLWPLKRDVDNPRKRMFFEDVAVVVVDGSLDMSIHCFENRILIRLIHEESKALIPDIIACNIRECLTSALKNISQLYHQLCFRDEGSAESNIELGFTVKPCCSSAYCPCEVFSDFEPSAEKEWTCPNHNINHTVRQLRAWFKSEKQEEDCSQGICPVSDRQFLCQYPTDLHLKRLSLQINYNYMRTLFHELGQETVQWENLNAAHKSPENVIFESLMKWRDASETGTFDELKSALEQSNITEHKLCKVFREKYIDFDKADPYLDRSPTDEDIDKLALLIGSDSLHFLVELGMEFTEWKPIEHNCGLDLVKMNRTILKTWRENCEKTERKPCLRNIYQAFANTGKIQRVVDRCMKRPKN